MAVQDCKQACGVSLRHLKLAAWPSRQYQAVPSGANTRSSDHCYIQSMLMVKYHARCEEVSKRPRTQHFEFFTGYRLQPCYLLSERWRLHRNWGPPCRMWWPWRGVCSPTLWASCDHSASPPWLSCRSSEFFVLVHGTCYLAAAM